MIRAPTRMPSASTWGAGRSSGVVFIVLAIRLTWTLGSVRADGPPRSRTRESRPAKIASSQQLGSDSNCLAVRSQPTNPFVSVTSVRVRSPIVVPYPASRPRIATPSRGNMFGHPRARTTGVRRRTSARKARACRATLGVSTIRKSDRPSKNSLCRVKIRLHRQDTRQLRHENVDRRSRNGDQPLQASRLAGAELGATVPQSTSPA